MVILFRQVLLFLLSFSIFLSYAQAEENPNSTASNSVILSPDKSRNAYVAASGSQYFVITDNQFGEPYDAIDSVMFSADSKHVAYKAKKADNWIVVADNKEYNPYPDPEHITFSPDGKKIMIFYKGGKSWVISYDTGTLQNIKTVKNESDNKFSAGTYLVSGPYSGLGTGINVDYNFNPSFAFRFSYAAQAGVINNINWDGTMVGAGFYGQTLPLWIMRYYGGVGLASVSLKANNGGYTAAASAGGITYFMGLKFDFTKNLTLDLGLNGLAQGITGGLNYIF